MDDLIRRQDAVKSMTNAIWHYPNEMYAQLNSYEMAEALAKDGLMFIPSAQKKGHWIDVSTTREQKWKCSECGEETTSSAIGLPRYRFCPMCGAYMISHNGNSEEYWMRCNKAWMPLPEPYKGGEK